MKKESKIECLEACEKHDVSCPVKDCRLWIDYKAERNCTFHTVKTNGEMDFSEIGKRFNVTKSMAHYIYKKAIKKMKFRAKM